MDLNILALAYIYGFVATVLFCVSIQRNSGSSQSSRYKNMKQTKPNGTEWTSRTQKTSFNMN